MGRRKLPEHLKKVKKTFKLSPDVVKKIDDKSKKQEISKTRYLETLVKND
jgi:hypothetical protein